ncbi:uncharacterized protein CTRU02_203385 [Colletotrichum truncatum]|uniref:Uncharacterized protein n=1 Tax=Colletotrichum truncatum TaxID=5467 RepID=A0ACC3Z935_COLTU|nr:uncharacterized protein CTRU02_05767 [Colletotrichum truncatum]KAF6793512.1 hypothetical protein CTRU02_05767 [Colletotrichum truncatum]
MKFTKTSLFFVSAVSLSAANPMARSPYDELTSPHNRHSGGNVRKANNLVTFARRVFGVPVSRPTVTLRDVDAPALQTSAFNDKSLLDETAREIDLNDSGSRKPHLVEAYTAKPPTQLFATSLTVLNVSQAALQANNISTFTLPIPNIVASALSTDVSSDPKGSFKFNFTLTGGDGSKKRANFTINWPPVEESTKSMAFTKCHLTLKETTMMRLGRTWEIRAQPIKDIPAVCNNLWENLKQHGSCALLEKPVCGQDEENEGHLIWRFNIDLGCTKKMVESTWRKATENETGLVECADV